MKSNIKPKKFYADAEDMQEGWGKTLRDIDELKDKKSHNGHFSLNQFCYTLYLDGHAASTWTGFYKYAKRYFGRNFRWRTWSNLFWNWNEKQKD